MGYDAQRYATQFSSLMFSMRAAKSTVPWIPLRNCFDCSTRFDYEPIIFALVQVNCNNSQATSHKRTSQQLATATDKTTKNAEEQTRKQGLKEIAKKKESCKQKTWVSPCEGGRSIYRPTPEGVHGPWPCSSSLVEEEINTSHFLHIYLAYARLELQCVCRLMWH